MAFLGIYSWSLNTLCSPVNLLYVLQPVDIAHTYKIAASAPGAAAHSKLIYLLHEFVFVLAPYHFLIAAYRVVAPCHACKTSEVTAVPLPGSAPLARRQGFVGNRET